MTEGAAGAHDWVRPMGLTNWSYEPASHRALRGAAHGWPRVPAQVLRVQSAAVTRCRGAGGDSSEAGGEEPQSQAGAYRSGGR